MFETILALLFTFFILFCFAGAIKARYFGKCSFCQRHATVTTKQYVGRFPKYQKIKHFLATAHCRACGNEETWDEYDSDEL